jgi:hypothetical protein
MKNLAITGGLLVLAQVGATSPSVDTAWRSHSGRRHVRA